MKFVQSRILYLQIRLLCKPDSEEKIPGFYEIFKDDDDGDDDDIDDLSDVCLFLVEFVYNLKNNLVENYKVSYFVIVLNK